MPIGRRGSFTGSSKDVQGSGQGSNAVLSGTTGALTGNSDWTMGCHPFSHEVYLPMGIHLANTKMDQYLHSLGLFRYHLPVDGSCLFRAVSEVLYGSQNKHAAIRRLVCDFILENRPLVPRQLDPQQSHEDYVRRLRENSFPGNNNEMHVLAQLFRIDFVVYYRADRGPTNVTQGGYPLKVTLCWSHGKQYDLVYTKEHLEALTVSQAIVYDVLYKDVFELGGKEVDFAVTKMLYDKEHFKNKRHLTFSQWCNSVAEGEERNVSKLPEKNGEQIVLAVRCGVPPFPFKVAKCLDPNLFRNVDYLNWCEEKRDEFRTGHLVTPALDTGVKCTARIGMKEHTGFVQSIDTKGNTAQVFLQSIGEIRTLPLSSIESLPVSLRVTLASHHALRNNAVEDDEHCRTYRVAVSSGKSQARNRRSFSTGDAVTADQLEVLLRKQQHSVHKRAHGGTSKDSSENSPSKLGGIPEAAHDRDSLGSHSVSTQEGSRSQGGQNMKMSEHDDVMSTHEDAENVARHTRGRPRKFSLPAVKTNYGPPSSPVASCYTPTIMNACGPVLVNGHPGTYGAIDAVSGLAGISESGVTVVPQLSARPAQTIIFDPNYSYATADIQRVPDSTIYATAPGTTAHGGCGFQHPPMGIGEYPIVPMNPVPVVPIAQFNPSVPPPNYRTIPALHSLVAPASAATTDWTLDYPMESVEPGFSFRAPPQEMNMSLIDMSHFLDGSDLPLHRLDIVRYFFNLGLSVYRSRKLPEGTPADSLPAPVACTQAAPTGTYIVPLTSSAGYQMVPPQGTVVYQQAPPASYPTTAGPTYASYSVLPQAASYTEISPSTITTAGPTSYAASVPAAAPVQAQMTAVK